MTRFFYLALMMLVTPLAHSAPASAYSGSEPSSLVKSDSFNTASKRPPNIVLIMADDLGYECIGADGGTSYKTPVLDRLAKNGMRFEHCYAQPLCTPSRVQIMTGAYNIRNYVQFGKLDRKQTTFAHLLKTSGYATCIVGKWQLGQQADSPRHFGFDESCLWQHTRKGTSRYPNPGLEINGKQTNFANGEYAPDVVSDFACDFIERNKDQPFLLYYPMILTHCPSEPTPDSPDWDPANKGSATYKGDPKYFGDMVSYMDKIVGKIVDKLEELNLRENTLVIFTGDNGTDLPIVSVMDGQKIAGAKKKTTDGGTRVPLIVNMPGTILANQVSADLVDFSDFLPTFCQLSSTPMPEDLRVDGQSFWPLLIGETYEPRDSIYCWFSRSGKPGTEKIFARNQRYKLYRSGKFFDIENDRLEQNPLNSDPLSPDLETTRQLLQKTLDRFADARFSIPMEKQQANTKKMKKRRRRIKQ